MMLVKFLAGRRNLHAPLFRPEHSSTASCSLGRSPGRSCWPWCVYFIVVRHLRLRTLPDRSMTIAARPTLVPCGSTPKSGRFWSGPWPLAGSPRGARTQGGSLRVSSRSPGLNDAGSPLGFVEHLAGLRLAGARHRRGLPLLHAHGPAPVALDAGSRGLRSGDATLAVRTGHRPRNRALWRWFRTGFETARRRPGLQRPHHGIALVARRAVVGRLRRRSTSPSISWSSCPASSCGCRSSARSPSGDSGPWPSASTCSHVDRADGSRRLARLRRDVVYRHYDTASGSGASMCSRPTGGRCGHEAGRRLRVVGHHLPGLHPVGQPGDGQGERERLEHQRSARERLATDEQLRLDERAEDSAPDVLTYEQVSQEFARTPPAPDDEF